ncbi:AAA family ATPase [Kriegella aquimaris]|uniref:AAA domain-containing protein, putative AbiEii toxin, Type IV TA system n=1 Tax=Kriegella aquimaris TaxID=192904 RepID=A0A1G9V2G7_9FLAO|nr:AAA family ATPase [Kriegella aquimaris]SDM66075.1 AAA domain-containing protein, putative AbiEii toxin, Type IV TA system [Kriegella aquimaris]
MNFFVVSAGKPGSDYIEDNFTDIIETNEFALHPDTQQKGTYYSIESNDILIIKYERKLVAFGIVSKVYEDKSKDFSLRVKVKEWVLHIRDNPKLGVSRYGIQKATIGGGRYGTVKTVRPNFGLDKIKEINATHASIDIIQKRYDESESNLEKEGDYFKLHEEIFNYLLEKSETFLDLHFVVRASNNKGNLDKGYWFYGEETVAISFWTGMDYKKDRPAISFLINPNEPCKLIIQSDIYERLRNFLVNNEFWTNKLELIKDDNGKSFYKNYNYPLIDYINSLDKFLNNDYRYINNIIETINKSENEGYQIDENIIKFPAKEFNERINNLFRFRQSESAELTLYSVEDENRADILNKIAIKDYGLIKNEELIFSDSNWVFITGENGSGKTMLLRAIGTTLGNRTLSPQELRDKNFTVNAELSSLRRTIPFSRFGNENVKLKRAIVSRGLAMYGPYRLQQTSGKIEDQTFKKALSKKGSFQSLFEDGSKLLSFDKQLELWDREGNRRNYNLDSRMNQIASLLPRLIPDLRTIKYKRKGRGKFDIEYLIHTKGSEELTPLKWNELSSGNKNILNLVSDIIIRLFYQQPKISDPSELRGIVLIDEIDLHLHPKAQRDLVITLSETFPLLQFIVTTHSPIPLLGAPEDSAFFVVNRDCDKGVYTTRLYDLEENFKNLLPNALLTSDLFDLEEITHKDVNVLEVNTLDSFDKYELDIELNEQLNILKAKDDETFNDFIK